MNGASVRRNRQESRLLREGVSRAGSPVRLTENHCPDAPGRTYFAVSHPGLSAGARYIPSVYGVLPDEERALRRAGLSQASVLPAKAAAAEARADRLFNLLLDDITDPYVLAGRPRPSTQGRQPRPVSPAKLAALAKARATKRARRHGWDTADPLAPDVGAR